MARKVLITGATGDTGRASVREAVTLDLDVRAMVRKIDERSDALAAQGSRSMTVGEFAKLHADQLNAGRQLGAGA